MPNTSQRIRAAQKRHEHRVLDNTRHKGHYRPYSATAPIKNASKRLEVADKIKFGHRIGGYVLNGDGD